MQTKIVVVVGRYPGEEEVRVRIRKAILNDAGDRVIRKAVLMPNGRWKPFESLWPEGSSYKVDIHEIMVEEVVEE